MSEVDFVSKFVTLATLSEPVLANNYQKPLQEVSNLGVALPALRYKYVPRRRGVQQSNVSIELNSVGSTKFTEKHEFNSDETILQVKEYLVKLEKAQTHQQIKLLLKGKVLHDSLLLSDLGCTEVSLKVMISKASAVSATTTEMPLAKESTTLELPWDEIDRVLQNHFNDAGATSEASARLRKGWQLARS